MLIQEPLNQTFIPNGMQTVKEMTREYLDFLEKRNLIYEKNTVKHERLKLPNNLNHFKDINEKRKFKEELFRRWKYGCDGMCGMMYAHFNYFRIHDRARGGMINPKYRHYENLTFSLVESCLHGKNEHFEDNTGQGIIYLSRRGFGKSADFGSIGISAISTMKEISVKVTSKDDTDVKKFLKEKVKMTYYDMKEYLRFSEVTNNREEFHIGLEDKTKGGLTFITGNNSKIIGAAPTLASLEGGGARIVIIDEAGKIKGLTELVDNMLPSLCGEDGVTRVGVPLIGGVAGEFDVFGSDYQDLWEKAELRALLRWFVPGWAGIRMDEFGNDDIEQAVEMIFIERINAQKISENKLITNLKQYPLTPEEALNSSTTGVLNKKKIMYQCGVLGSNTKVTKPGTMGWQDKHSRIPHFIPDDNGKLEILEHPLPEIIAKNGYIAFTDAYDIKEKKEKQSNTVDGSVGAFYVLKRRMNLSIGERKEIYDAIVQTQDLQEKKQLYLALGELPVAEYIEGQDDPRDFAEKCAMLMYYYHCKNLVEKFPSQIYTYLFENYKTYMQYKPVLPGERLKAENFEKYGIKITEEWKKERTSLLQSYVEDNYERIYFPRLLKDMNDYDPSDQRKKKDSVDAFGGCLIHDRQPYLKGEIAISSGYDDDVLFGAVDDGNGGFKFI